MEEQSLVPSFDLAKRRFPSAVYKDWGKEKPHVWTSLHGAWGLDSATDVNGAGQVSAMIEP